MILNSFLWSVTSLSNLPNFSRKLIIGINTSKNYRDSSQIWKPTIDYLNNHFEDYEFQPFYIKYEELDNIILEKKVNFLIIEPSSLIDKQKKYNLTLLGSVLRNHNGNDVSKKSAVIFTDKNRIDIKNLNDIEGKRLLVNSINSYITKIAFVEFFKNGMNPTKTFSNIAQLENSSDIDVVYKILSAKRDIGIVESGVLEKMVEKKLLNMKNIRILNQKNHQNFPYLSSTKLYPDIVIAKLSHTSNKDAKKLLSALFLLTPNSKASKNANISTWYVPREYDDVKNLLKDMKIINSKHYYRDLVYKIYENNKTSLLFCTILLIILIFLLERKAILRREIAKLTIIDPLTNLYNREKINHILDNEFRRSARYGHPFSIIILSLKSLKDINKNYNHKIGDKILVYVAEKIKKNIRIIDQSSRWSSDKFLLVCPNTKYEDTLLLAQKIKNVIDNKVFLENIKINSSIGIGSFNKKDKSTSSMIDRANEELMEN